MARNRPPARKRRPAHQRAPTIPHQPLTADTLGRGGRLSRPTVSAIAATAVSALLLWLSYPLPDLGFLAWVALVPWVTVVLRAAHNRIAWTLWPVWLVWSVVVLAWLRFATVAGWVGLARKRLGL